jgi:hypothetical protein
MTDVTLTSPNPVIDTRPDKKESLLPSVQDYYERFRNPNLFISNNANPFLISPYAPNQLSQTTKNTILATDLIKPFTPNKTIVVEGNMQMASGYFFEAGPNKPLFNNRIYSDVFPDAPAEATCFSSPFPGFTVSLGTGITNINRFVVEENSAFFTNSTAGSGTFAVNVEGKVAIDSLTGGLPNPIELTTTTLGAAAPVTLQGYVPMLVNGGQVYVPFYSSP